MELISRNKKYLGLSIIVFLTVGLGWLIKEKPQPPFGAVLTISQKIQDKTAIQRATIKGQEITKIGSIPITEVKFSNADFKVQVVSINSIPRGVEVLARAWNPDDTQIGFGDGTVDIERFRIMNPPIMIPDGTTHTETDKWGSYEAFNYKEDAKMALLQTLVHAISVKQRFDSSRIIASKVGSTTTTCFPDADPESTTVDGDVAYDSTEDTFANVRAATGTGARPSNASVVAAYIQATATTNKFDGIYAFIALFDCSSIPDTDTISAAVASFYPPSNATNGLSQNVVLTNSNPASNTNLVSGDYAGRLTAMATELGTGRVSMTSWTTGAYIDFNVTSPDSNISKTGITKLGTRTSSDFDNSSPTWVDSALSIARTYSADQAGTSNDPQLVVTSAAGAGGSSGKKQSELLFQ